MRSVLLSITVLLCAAPAFAQSSPPEGGFGGGHAPGGRPRPMEGGRPGGDRPPRQAPIKREQLDKQVKTMFQVADRNGDGRITLPELQAVIEARREARIRTRFKQIDTNGDQSASEAEFLAWQRGLGAVASAEQQQVAGFVSEDIAPEAGGNRTDMVLARLIEPISAVSIVNANTDYDAGVSLEELLVYERKRFDQLDADRDGELNMEELRGLDPVRGRKGYRDGNTPDGPTDRPPPSPPPAGDRE